MKTNRFQRVGILFLPLVVASAGVVFHPPVKARGQELQERVAELKESTAKNKQSLAQYTWVEQVNISLKGELKKQQHFQVRWGWVSKKQRRL